MSIDVKGITKAFGKQQVLREVTLQVAAGSIYGLLGRNGAGKTTLLKTVAGLLVADGGSARTDGVVTWVSEQTALPSVYLNTLLALEADLAENFDRLRVEVLLNQLQIPLTKTVPELSVGQRRRFELELAFARSSTVLLLDEAFNGLDPVAHAEVLRALTTHVADTSAAVLLSSHSINDLERVCDRIGFLAHGRIAYEVDTDVAKESLYLLTGSAAHDAPKSITGAEVISSRVTDESRRLTVQSKNGKPSLPGFHASQPPLRELCVEIMSALEGRP